MPVPPKLPSPEILAGLALQSNAYNCGSTALHAAMRYLDLNPDLTPADVEVAVGTNPVIGTTPPLLDSGLRRLRLDGRYTKASVSGKAAVERLHRNLDMRIGLLRVVIGESRHWILVTRPIDDAQFEAWDPSSGLRKLDWETLRKWWRPSQHAGFWLSRSPRDHIAQSHPVTRVTIDTDLQHRHRPIHAYSLGAFLGPAARRVLRTDQFGQTELDWIAQTAAKLGSFASDPQFRRMPFAHPTLDFFGERGNDVFNSMLVRRRSDGEPVGCVSMGTPYVPPAYRGQGIGAAIVLAAYSHPNLRFLNPTHYSEDGFRARISAWKAARTAAGLDASVPAEYVVPTPVEAPRLELTP